MPPDVMPWVGGSITYAEFQSRMQILISSMGNVHTNWKFYSKGRGGTVFFQNNQHQKAKVWKCSTLKEIKELWQLCNKLTWTRSVPERGKNSTEDLTGVSRQSYNMSDRLDTTDYCTSVPCTGFANCTVAIEENTPSLRKNTCIYTCIHKDIYPSKTNPVSEYRQTGAYIHVYICGRV